MEVIKQNTMKKAFYALISIAFMAAAVACSNGNKLQKIVKQINDTCPVYLSNELSMTGAAYENETVCIFYDYDSEYFNLDFIRQNEDVFRNNTLTVLSSTSDKRIKEMLSLIAEEDADFEMVFTKPGEGEYSLHFTSEELKEMSTAPVDSRKQLETVVASIKMQLPIDTGQGLIVKDAILEDNNLVYVNECDEKLISIDLLNERRALVKTSIQQEFSNKRDQVTQSQLKLMKECNVNLAYRYVGNTSGKTCEVVIGYDEL